LWIYLNEPGQRSRCRAGRRRGTIKAAIDEGVPAPVLTTALYARFSSRGDSDFQDKLLSAMRYGFGGHLEKPTK
jgi:6-phosphogluconate dehydrogenase